MACVPCAAAAVSVVGAPIAIPGAIAGYIGYKAFSKKPDDFENPMDTK